MARTTDTLVKGLLLLDYDANRSPSLQPFIDTATVLVDRVAVCASALDEALTVAELELIERWLSAHYYVQSDQTFASKSTSGASATHHGQTGMRLENSKYGQGALSLDTTGCLDQLANKSNAKARAHWLGRPPSEQTAYEDRR